MAHPIVHFEMPVDDVDRARKFYQGLFGWQFEDTGQDYHLIQTGEGELGGGMGKRVMPEQRPVFYIAVESVDDYIKKIEDAGGTVVTPKGAVPTMGYYAHALDTEGNAFAIWEDNPQAQ